MGAERTPFRLFYKVGRMSPPGPFFVGFHGFPSHLARRDVHLSAESLHKATQGAGVGVGMGGNQHKMEEMGQGCLNYFAS